MLVAQLEVEPAEARVRLRGRTRLPPAAAPPTSPATSWIADYALRAD